MPVRVRVPHGKGEKGSNKIEFELQAVDRPDLNVTEEAVFIDDNLRNVKAAEEMGIKSIHFKNPEQLRSELTDMRLL